MLSLLLCAFANREDPEVLLEERQELKTDIEDQLEEVGRLKA